MNVLITLTTAGADTGPFNLYSNVDNYTTAFDTNISRGILVAGYTSTVVPPGTTAIRVKSAGVCANYVDITLTVPSTTTTTTTAASTTTTTTAAPATTTTTTTAAPVVTTTTTTTYVGPVTTTTTSTTAAPVTTTTTTTAAPTPTTTTTTTYVGPATTTTTSTSTTLPVTTTTTTTPLQWYQITNCATLAVDYTAGYAPGSFALNERVQDIPLNTYTITQTYSANPGGSGLFIFTTGLTGCVATTTTTTAAPSVATNILVEATNYAGPDQDCLGTPYSVTVTSVTATLYDQYGVAMAVVGSPLTVVVNSTYQPCSGGSSTTTHNIVIPVGNTSASTSWDASRTVDCGGFGCLLETDTYDCAFSNTASLPWRSGTVSC